MKTVPQYWINLLSHFFIDDEGDEDDEGDDDDDDEDGEGKKELGC